MPDESLNDRSLVFEWDDIKKILALAKAESQRDYTIFITLALTGRRLGEIVGRDAMIGRRGAVPNVPGIRVCDINFHDQQIRYTIEKKFKDKGHTERVTRIKDALPELLEILDIWIKTNRLQLDDRLFIISERRVNQILHRYCAMAGIFNKQRLCHAFRHGFGLEFSKHMEKPSDMVILQDIMDHVNAGQTMSYIQMASGERKKALGRITLTQENELSANGA